MATGRWCLVSWARYTVAMRAAATEFAVDAVAARQGLFQAFQRFAHGRPVDRLAARCLRS